MTLIIDEWLNQCNDLEKETVPDFPWGLSGGALQP